MIAAQWTAGLDFSAAACHADGCPEPVATYWRSCYADLALCRSHEAMLEAVMFADDDDVDFSCCWYPFAWRVAPADATGEG